MHGDPPERIAPKIADMRRRREQVSEALGVELPPLQFGVAGYAIVRFFIEFVRNNQVILLGLTGQQLFCLGLLAALGGWYAMRRRPIVAT